MTETKHTPGPWVVEPENYDCDGGTLVRTKGKICLANVWGVMFAKTPDDESLANARLIAAAPDLLEALEYLAGACELALDNDYPEGRDPVSVARAAIAKAKGEQA